MKYERINNPLMEFYRQVYRYSNRWDGTTSLNGKKVIVYCEQGFGDIIQFLRYIKALKQTGCHTILAIPNELHPLLSGIDGVDEYFDKNCSILPKHDYHILSLSLPFLLGIKEIPTQPYVSYQVVANLESYNKGVKIGIAWEGSPDHPKNLDRCCPLKKFKALLEEDTTLFMLQNKIHLPELVEDVDFDIYSIPIKDFGDVASLINAMDFVVTVDTSILHLSGAMGKRTYGIMGTEIDPRWNVDSWYDSVSLLTGEWDDLFKIVNTCRKR